MTKWTHGTKTKSLVSKQKKKIQGKTRSKQMNYKTGMSKASPAKRTKQTIVTPFISDR